ncbi:DUF4407 domain-containing protein [Nocardia sp. NBC_01503]|uniref:DUF4407 domain-containing protein n=1 Tax=Nocardia sp. NBC_01503 TaxID=2975997 RepID=UPI003FA5742A
MEWVPEERPRFVRLGATLLISFALVAVSMFVALNLIGAPPSWAFPIAVVWGNVILNLDRWPVERLQFQRARKRLRLSRSEQALPEDVPPLLGDEGESDRAST